MPTIEEVVEESTEVTTTTTKTNNSPPGQTQRVETPEQHVDEEDDDDDDDEDYEDVEDEENEEMEDDDEEDQNDEEEQDEEDDKVFKEGNQNNMMNSIIKEFNPVGETIQALVMSKEDFTPYMKEKLKSLNLPLYHRQLPPLKEVERTFYCVGEEMCGLVRNAGIELTPSNDGFAPHMKFSRMMADNLTSHGVVVRLLELFNIPMNSLWLYRITEKNSKITIERVKDSFAFPVFVVVNTVKGKREFDEFSKEAMTHSSDQGYFDLALADRIIKENENNSSAINWREKSKEIFKLYLPSSGSETPSADENEKWHQYFASRTSAQKQHNSFIEKEYPEEGDYVCRNMMRALKNVLRGDNLTQSVARDFCAQTVIKSKDAGYMDFEALQDLRMEGRIYSTHSYQCLDVRYSYYHKTRYYSHDYFAKLEYRILPLAVDNNEKDKKKKDDEIPWSIFFENYLDEPDRIPQEDWIIIEKRKFLFTLKHLRSVRNAILSNDPDSPYSKISDIQLLKTIYHASGATNGEDSLLEGDWVGYRMRQLAGCPSEKDYEYEEIDFDKVIEDHLKEIRERRRNKKYEEEEGDDDDDDDEYYDDDEGDEDDDDFHDNPQANIDMFMRSLAGQRGTGQRGQQVPPGCAQQ
ncbi:hypothetical protein FDP41_007762 [Naegleria fowleri]|uniref:Uncharacterized protein n=1 Tax=Naegleria fowleri TaxID=5763 RepID=A0A6A5C3B3_NAEFO|nr:uncharacterized protein FDP41_007762 [Naegleria fowleri]KAF0983847.1 hypothetical protein FDP41_007762 [Naegleria fowleri]CAG4714074.1 unnamed protein product [Naegleria fowleri]